MLLIAGATSQPTRSCVLWLATSTGRTWCTSSCTWPITTPCGIPRRWVKQQVMWGHMRSHVMLQQTMWLLYVHMM